MSFMEWPQPEASFNVCQDNYGKNGGKLAGHSLEGAAASSEQRKEQRMGSSYPDGFYHN